MGLLWSDADFKRARRAIRKIERMPRPEEFLQDSPRQIVPNVYVRVIGEGSGGGGIASGEEGLATLLRRVDGSWEETVWTWRIVNQTGRTLQEGEDVIADWESQSGYYVVWSVAPGAQDAASICAVKAACAVGTSSTDLLVAEAIGPTPDSALFEIVSGKIRIKQTGTYRLDQFVGVSPTMSIDFSGNTMLVADAAVMDASTEEGWDGDLGGGGAGPFVIMPWNFWQQTVATSPSVPGTQDATTHTIRRLVAGTSVWGYYTRATGAGGSLWHQLCIARLD